MRLTVKGQQLCPSTTWSSWRISANFSPSGVYQWSCHVERMDGEFMC